MKDGIWSKLILLTQFSLSLLSPMALFVLLALWIMGRFGTGYWVMIAGILLGAASMGHTFYKFYKKYARGDEDEPRPPQSNRHR